jgi:glycosyltransferase involved in cell wall biosynthesis
VKISLITVTYNSAATIGDTLASVNRQTHPDVEYIVIDGGSKDDTVAIVKACGERVAQFVSERDRGIYDAMNKGIARATGDVIGFLNSDDVLADDDVLAGYARAFASQPVDALYGDLVYTERDDLTRVLRYWRGTTYRAGAFARGWVPAHPSFYARRAVYRAHGSFDLGFPLAADFEIMCRFLHARGVPSAYLPGVKVRMRVGGATNVSLRNVWRQNLEIVRAMRRHGVPVGPGFISGKLASRATQWMTRGKTATTADA